MGASAASLCSAVVLPLVERSRGRWVAAATAPLLVPLLSLGRRMVATEGGGTFSLAPAAPAAGGPRLRPLALEPEFFEAAEMQAVTKDLMSMKVAELKEELHARGEGVSGNKAWLRRRLHAAIVHARLAGAAAADF